MFVKWPEAGLIHPLTSAKTAKYFHNNIVCCYGVPVLVHTDHGPEHHVDFAQYCKMIGIIQKYTLAQNPWTNGLVKRMNATIKVAIQKCLDACPGAA